MTTLIIGGDTIETIRRKLAAHGLDDVEHWGGRKPADARRAIPARVRLVVMVTDQLNHSMLYNATIRATRLGLPIIYSRRSAHELRSKLEEHFGQKPINSRPSPVIRAGWLPSLPFLAISY